MLIFSKNLLSNVLSINHDFTNFWYKHANYERFHVNDPKQRIIHKASVRDRLVHHTIYRVLYPIFDRSFIIDSYSCRNQKGTHKAVDRLEFFIRKVSQNYTRPCFALKCDVKKFFDSVDHQILLKIIKKKIKDVNSICLLEKIIDSFSSKRILQLALFERESKTLHARGIPIGNLTSQLFANIYLNELDRFVKHQLRVKSYLRYCDDFIILASDENKLTSLKSKISAFLKTKLKLDLHQNKVSIRKLRQGIDFLGYVTLPYYRVLRTRTKKRMFKKINDINKPSYLGLLKHCNSYKIRRKLIS